MINQTPEEIEIIMEAKNKIMEAINKDDPYTPVNEMNLLLNTLTEEYKKENKLEKIEKKINHILTNPDANRLLRLNQKVKMEMETSIELYDKDIGEDERLHYHNTLEKQILDIQQDIRKALSIIIKTRIMGDIKLD